MKYERYDDSWNRGFAYGVTEGEKKVDGILDKISAEIEKDKAEFNGHDIASKAVIAALNDALAIVEKYKGVSK